MIMTRNVNKISILMGLIIMKANKKFQSNRLLRIFGISGGISKTFVKHMNNFGRTDTRPARVIIRRGIHAARNCRAVSVKNSWNTEEYFRTFCNNKSNWG